MANNPPSAPVFGGGSGSGSGTYIGIPDDYTVPNQPNARFPRGEYYYSGRRRERQRLKKRYKQGSDWAIIAGKSPEQLAQVQKALVRIGYLDPDKVLWTRPDTATKNALNRVLGEANAKGMRWGDYLDETVKFMDDNDIATPGSMGAAPRPLQINLANPDTIKASVAQASTELLGGAYAGDPQHYVDEIHAQQRKQQTDEYWQTGGPEGQGGPGGETYDPAAVSALIMKEKPVDYGVEQSGSKAQAVLEGLLSRHAPQTQGL